MLDYLLSALNRLVSIKDYVIYIFVQKWGRESWFVEYLLLFVLIYLIFFLILHRIYRFFVKSTIKQKEKYYFASDDILYHYQLENQNNPSNIERISDFVSKKSYIQSYDLLLKKAKELSKIELENNLKKSYKSFKMSSSNKKIVGLFLTIISLGIYAIFVEK